MGNAQFGADSLSMTSLQGLNPEIQRAGSSRGTCKGLGEHFAVTAAGITGAPSSRCWESCSSQPGSSCPPSCRSHAAFHFWPGLTSIYCFFGSELMLLGCRSTSQDGFFHWERSHKVKDHFIWSKRGAWEIYSKLNKLFHLSWTQACSKAIWNPGRKPPQSIISSPWSWNTLPVVHHLANKPASSKLY